MLLLRTLREDLAGDVAAVLGFVFATRPSAIFSFPSVAAMSRKVAVGCVDGVLDGCVRGKQEVAMGKHAKPSVHTAFTRPWKRSLGGTYSQWH